MMVSTLGFTPSTNSKEETSEPGGPVVRFKMFAACSNAYGQKEMGDADAVMCARAFSTIERMARSATPLRECT